MVFVGSLGLCGSLKSLLFLGSLRSLESLGSLRSPGHLCVVVPNRLLQAP